MVNIGDTAPAFTLRATDKRAVSSSEYAGKKLILAFYPGAFTGVCDKEMCAIRDNMAALNDADAVVLGISVAATIGSLRTWIKVATVVIIAHIGHLHHNLIV